MALQKRLFVAFVFFEVTVMLSSDLYSRPFMSSITKIIQKLQNKCIKYVEFDFNGQYAISKYYRQPYRTDQ